MFKGSLFSRSIIIFNILSIITLIIFDFIVGDEFSLHYYVIYMFFPVFWSALFSTQSCEFTARTVIVKTLKKNVCIKIEDIREINFEKTLLTHKIVVRYEGNLISIDEFGYKRSDFLLIKMRFQQIKSKKQLLIN